MAKDIRICGGVLTLADLNHHAKAQRGHPLARKLQRAARDGGFVEQKRPQPFTVIAWICPSSAKRDASNEPRSDAGYVDAAFNGMNAWPIPKATLTTPSP